MGKRPEYAIVIAPLSEEDGGGYVATVPDLPGCMSDGETEAEAIENVHDAIACWIEAAQENGRAIPEPSPSGIFDQISDYARKLQSSLLP
jgi:antitoxin HicB